MSQLPKNKGKRMYRDVLAMATAVFLSFLVTLFLVIERTISESDFFAVRMEQKISRLEFDQIAQDTVLQLNEIAFWDEAYRKLVKREKPSLDFARSEIRDWLLADFGYDAIHLLDESANPILTVGPGSVSSGDPNSEVIRSNLDMHEAAARRFQIALENRFKDGIVQPIAGTIDPDVSVTAFRFVEGRPSILASMVLLPDSEEEPIDRSRTITLLAVKHLDGADLEAITARLGLQKTEFRSAASGELGIGFVNLPNLQRKTGIAFTWLPFAPRPVILRHTLPFAGVILLVLLCGLGMIIRQHAITIKALAESEAENEFNANHDSLTRIANRSRFNQQLDHLCTSQPMQPFAVLAIDLDKFKAINDTHGHAAGDAVLVETARRFRERIGKKGMVARIGGDEFVALITEFKDREDLQWLADAMIEDASLPFVFRDSLLQIGASIGIAIAFEHGKDPRSLMNASDAALYESKLNGRGKATFFTQKKTAMTKAA